jgi:hypothetical protein
MEQPSNSNSIDPAEWCTASYIDDPINNLEPLDPESSEYRRASLRFLQLVLQMDDHMTGHRDASLSWLSISFALGLTSTRGKTLTQTAVELGISKQALSRYVTSFLRVSGLEPAFGLKSKESRLTYQRTNGQKRIDVDDADDYADIDPDIHEPHADSVQPLL